MQAELCENGLAGVAVALLAAALACTVPAPAPEWAVAPVPTLEATPEWPPAFSPSTVLVVDRTEDSLEVMWGHISRATSYDVQRSDSEYGDYAVVASGIAALGLVDDGLQPDSVYYYKVRACNHLGCTEFSDDAAAGTTESDADVSIPPAPMDVRVVRVEVPLFPDLDEVTWTTVEGATYYQVYRAGDLLTVLSAPRTLSSHTDLGRSLDLSVGTYYQVKACNKAGCSPLS